jgi:hypothetical protein
MKKLFICSSVASLDVALALKNNLSGDFMVTTWKENTFQLGHHNLDSIIKASTKYHYVLLVLTPDVVQTFNNNTTANVKDNIIFEMGFFIGIFGKERTFFIVENAPDFKLPTYVSGINYTDFIKPNGPDLLETSLQKCCVHIKNAISEKDDHPHDKQPHFVTDLLRVFCQSLASPFTAEDGRLRAFIFKKDGQTLKCTNLWVPNNIDICESVGISFDINAETAKQVAVVMAAERRSVCGVSVSILPDQLEGVHGDVDKNLCFILAAPIIGPQGDVWGTIDIDASHYKGEYILRAEPAKTILYQFGKLLYQVITQSQRKAIAGAFNF